MEQKEVEGLMQLADQVATEMAKNNEATLKGLTLAYPFWSNWIAQMAITRNFTETFLNNCKDRMPAEVRLNYFKTIMTGYIDRLTIDNLEVEGPKIRVKMS